MEKVKIMNMNGQKEDFCAYYETLTATQCEDYDNEAKQLVKDNGQVKAIIENGKLHQMCTLSIACSPFSVPPA
ncbi:hypothetical protein BKA83DRAFT_4496145 [Pisolithus microcarpus]|nr:hypothetical protein BKA83DRAFT_4496145 [Pisolithus microcarpus]